MKIDYCLAESELGMTKKDYELIEQGIEDGITQYMEYNSISKLSDSDQELIVTIVSRLARTLKDNNPQFLYYKFLEGCGVDWYDQEVKTA